MSDENLQELLKIAQSLTTQIQTLQRTRNAADHVGVRTENNVNNGRSTPSPRMSGPIPPSVSRAVPRMVGSLRGTPYSHRPTSTSSSVSEQEILQEMSKNFPRGSCIGKRNRTPDKKLIPPVPFMREVYWVDSEMIEALDVEDKSQAESNSKGYSSVTFDKMWSAEELRKTIKRLFPGIPENFEFATGSGKRIKPAVVDGEMDGMKLMHVTVKKTLYIRADGGFSFFPKQESMEQNGLINDNDSDDDIMINDNHQDIDLSRYSLQDESSDLRRRSPSPASSVSSRIFSPPPRPLTMLSPLPPTLLSLPSPGSISAPLAGPISTPLPGSISTPLPRPISPPSPRPSSPLAIPMFNTTEESLQYLRNPIKPRNLDEPRPIGSVNYINVQRCQPLQGIYKAVEKRSFGEFKWMSVHFDKEPGADNGGLEMEMWRLALCSLENGPPFEDAGGKKTLLYSWNLINQKKYYLAAKVIALAIVHGGLSPEFFTEELFNLLISDDEMTVDVANAVVPGRVGILLTNLSNERDVKKAKSILNRIDGIGCWTGMPEIDSISQIPEIVKRNLLLI